jgi:hypothetical protein
MAITGECFCGEVQYRIAGALRDARSCHCSRCRKAFSSQASAYALVDPGDFEWMSGENSLTSYVNNEGFGFKFCSKCGSTLCGIVNDTIHGVTLGCLNGDPLVELNRHIYVGSKAHWETIPEGAPHYRNGVPDKVPQGQ